MLNIAFENKDLEKRFSRVVKSSSTVIGGLVFVKHDQLAGLHWKTHQRLFGLKSFTLITDWLICPNTSSKPQVEYQVSDWQQLAGIAEQTNYSRWGFYIPFVTGERASEYMDIWWKHFNWYNIAHSIVFTKWMWQPGIWAVTYTQKGSERKLSTGQFWHWNYINRMIREDNRTA